MSLTSVYNHIVQINWKNNAPRKEGRVRAGVNYKLNFSGLVLFKINYTCVALTTTPTCRFTL